MKAQSKINRSGIKSVRSAKGFTVVDLMVTLAVIAVLAVMVLPALGRTHSGGAVAQCLNNLRQIGAAWSMYSEDSAGDLIECHPWRRLPSGARASGTANPYSWAPGYAGMGSTATYGPLPLHSATNATGLQQTVFYRYIKDFSMYRCPSDTRAVEGLPVLRSYAMNSWMNGSAYNGGFRFFWSQGDILQPSTTWVVIDEDGLTLDDAMFTFFMEGRGFINLPGRRHSNGYTLLLADGHVESHRLQDAVNISVQQAPGSTGLAGSENTSDFQFLKSMTTY